MLRKELVQAGLHTMTADAALGSITVGASAAGATQATATAITTAVTTFTTVGAGQGAILPTSADIGDVFEVSNQQATNALLIYPQLGGAVNTAATNAGFSVAATKTALFRKVSATQWMAFLSA